jgi:FixJ family two-component response regulator
VSVEPPIIAVVDDDVSVCTGVQRLLQAAGLVVTTFGSGPAFLASLDRMAPDCIVLDIRMPAMTGFQVYARMREMGCTAPVIFISAEERARRHDDALSGGGYAFLQKPFDGEVLVKTIAEAIADRRAGRS